MATDPSFRITGIAAKFIIEAKKEGATDVLVNEEIFCDDEDFTNLSST